MDVNGTLTISGTGKMSVDWHPGYIPQSDPPWFDYINDINKLVIEEGVESIGHSAFRSCKKITELILPSSIKSIGYGAFEECVSISNIILNDGITSISENTFKNTAYYNNEDNWENGVLYIGDYLIGAKKDLKGSYTIKTGTKVISDNAFAKCTQIDNIIFPDGLEVIGKYSFSGCSQIKSIVFPNSTMIIDNGAFNECYNLTDIDLPDVVVLVSDPFGVSKFIEKEKPAFCRDESNWFKDNRARYGESLYMDEYVLISFESPDFYIKEGTKGVADINVETENVFIPSSVSFISNDAFFACRNLESISVDEKNEVYLSDNGILFSKDKKVLMIVPNGISDSYHVPCGVEKISEYAFQASKCSSIAIPDRDCDKIGLNQ